MSFLLIATMTWRAYFGVYPIPTNKVEACMVEPTSGAHAGELYVECSVSTNNSADDLSVMQYSNLLERISAKTGIRKVTVSFGSCGYDGIPSLDLPLSTFANMTNLFELNISGPEAWSKCRLRISSFAEIAHLPIAELQVRNVVPLEASSLSLMRRLNSVSTNEKDLVPHIPNGINELRLSDVSMGDCCDLSRFRELENLLLFDIKSRQVRGIGGMDKLGFLYLEGDFHVPREDILALTRLTYVHLKGRSWAYLFDGGNPFCHMPIDTMELDLVPISRLEGMEKCPLKFLRVADAPIKSLSDISESATLEWLVVWGTGIVKADREALLKRYPALKRFEYTDEIEGSEIVELAPREAK